MFRFIARTVQILVNALLCCETAALFPHEIMSVKISCCHCLWFQVSWGRMGCIIIRHISLAQEITRHCCMSVLCQHAAEIFSLTFVTYHGLLVRAQGMKEGGIFSISR